MPRSMPRSMSRAIAKKSCPSPKILAFSRAFRAVRPAGTPTGKPDLPETAGGAGQRGPEGCVAQSVRALSSHGRGLQFESGRTHRPYLPRACSPAIRAYEARTATPPSPQLSAKPRPGIAREAGTKISPGVSPGPSPQAWRPQNVRIRTFESGTQRACLFPCVGLAVSVESL